MSNGNWALLVGTMFAPPFLLRGIVIVLVPLRLYDLTVSE